MLPRSQREHAKYGFARFLASDNRRLLRPFGFAIRAASVRRWIQVVVEIIPSSLVNLVSFTTVFSVMTSIGTTITARDCLKHVQTPALLLRGLAAVVVIVPVIGIAASFAFGLSLPEKVGITLMVIAPGAPLALRRALGSGAAAGFAPTLQIVIAIVAVPAVPLWVEAANLILGTNGFVDPAAVARQVFLAQLLPLGLGAVVRRAAPIWGTRIGVALGRAGAVLLIVTLVAQIVNYNQLILATRAPPVISAAFITIVALWVGHLIGGGSHQVRHSMAIASSLRNVGLALLIATGNHTPPTVDLVIVGYALTAIVIVSLYIVLRQRRAPSS
jgi:BASS family bile acid:Na+ symporter